MSDKIDTAAMSRKVADPGFVVCWVMCYLGIQGRVLVAALELFLSAVWEAYRSALPEAEAKREMRSFYDETFVNGFRVAKVARYIFTFAVKNELPLKVQSVLPSRAFIKNKRIQRIRRKLYAYLLKKIAIKSSLIVAEQMLRKVVFYADLAIAGLCVSKCSIEHVVRELDRQLRKSLKDLASAYGAALGIVESVSQFVAREVLFRPMMETKVSMDTSNWRYSERHEIHADFHVVSQLIWRNKVRALNADDFLGFVGKKLPQIPLFTSLSLDGIAKTLSQSANVNEHAMRKKLQGWSYIELIRYLVEKKVIRFVRSPENIVGDELD